MAPEKTREERVLRLQRLIQDRDLVVVVGAGVSHAVTERKAPLWCDLLEQALAHCGVVAGLSKEVLDRYRAALGSGDLDEMLGVAGFVTKKLGGTKGKPYAAWLTDTFSPFEPTAPDVIEALAAWKMPLATTNYDTLLEQVSKRGTVTWLEPRRVLAALSKDARPPAIVHLHGVYDVPESVVLDGIDYDRLLRDGAAQDLQKGLTTFRTLLFVGCGGTLQDPNLGPLFRWLRETHPGHEHKHFQLCLAKEVAELEAEHARDGNGIEVVAYGTKHEDLAPFLSSLTPKLEASISRTTAGLAPPPTPEEAAAVRRRYLSWVLHRHQHVGLPIPDASGARGGETVLPLAGVYTALRTTSWVELARGNEGRPRFEKRRRLLTALEVLDRERLLVLLGDPGSGKSTFVAFLTACLAGEQIKEKVTNLRLLRQPLDARGADGKRSRAQPWHHGPLLPVPVVLRDFAARGGLEEGRCGARQLWRFLCAELEASGLEAVVPVLAEDLGARGGLVLLDGLDEVPLVGGLRRWVSAAIEDFAACHPRSRFLVTSRIHPYRGQGWGLRGFAETVLALFEADQIEVFLQRWYQQLALTGQLSAGDAASRAVELIPVALEQPRIRELAERPLLLSLVASLHYSRGRLPEDRAQLYKESVELLLDVWQARRRVLDSQGKPVVLEPSVAEWLKADRVQVRQALERLAFEAHARQAGELAGTADVLEVELAAALFQAGGVSGPRDTPANTALLVDYLRERAGLLLRRGDGVYTFPHRTLQEYLASRWLVEQEFPDGLAERARKDPDRWREVTLLAASSVRGVSQAVLWDFLDALCPWAAPQPGEAVQVEQQWGAQLAGLAAAESANIEHLPARQRLRIDRLRGWLVRVLTGSTLPALERVLGGRSLATLGDPRPEVTTLDAMQFCWVQGGRFLMGSEERHYEKPRHEVDIPYDYWLARFPVTVAQWWEYIAASGVKVEHADSLRGAANLPVVWINWHEALRFCCWLTERWRVRGLLPVDWSVQLPSEAEWEKAARGGLELSAEARVLSLAAISRLGRSEGRRPNKAPARRFPWGDRDNGQRANCAEAGVGCISAVGAFAGGRGPSGCEELSGNLWEWTRSHWGQDDVDSLPFPYVAGDGREDLTAVDGVLRVLRGGSYSDGAWWGRCSARGRLYPSEMSGGVGFRVLLSPHSASPSEL